MRGDEGADIVIRGELMDVMSGVAVGGYEVRASSAWERDVVVASGLATADGRFHLRFRRNAAARCVLEDPNPHGRRLRGGDRVVRK